MEPWTRERSRGHAPSTRSPLPLQTRQGGCTFLRPRRITNAIGQLGASTPVISACVYSRIEDDLLPRPTHPLDAAWSSRGQRARSPSWLPPTAMKTIGTHRLQSVPRGPHCWASTTHLAHLTYREMRSPPHRPPTSPR